MRENIIQTKSFDFAVKIALLGRELQHQHKEYILSKQIIRSGTSIGANVEEAIGGISKKDFRFKMGISYKEARETRYWLRVLHAIELISNEQFATLESECEEAIKILFKIIQSSSGD